MCTTPLMYAVFSQYGSFSKQRSSENCSQPRTKQQQFQQSTLPVLIGVPHTRVHNRIYPMDPEEDDRERSSSLDDDNNYVSAYEIVKGREEQRLKISESSAGGV
jgi:hypothetical protein